MVMTFAVLLGLIFILEIAAGITAYVLRDKAQDFVDEKLNLALRKYPTDEGIRKTWDRAQEEFQCCGVNNYTDWGNTVPASCCVPKGSDDCVNAPTKDNVYPNSCIDAFVKWIEDNIYIIGGVGIGLAFVQVIGMIIACCLGKSIRKEYEVV